MAIRLRRRNRHHRKRELIGDKMMQVDMHGKNARDNLQKLVDERITGMRELSAKNLEDELHRLKSSGFSDNELRAIKGHKSFMPPPSTYVSRVQGMY
jgi:hypothetical protein